MHTLSIDFLRTDTDAALREFMARANSGRPREPPSAPTPVFRCFSSWARKPLTAQKRLGADSLQSFHRFATSISPMRYKHLVAII